MVDHADAVIDNWRPGQLIEIYEAMRSAVRRSITECLFGSRLGVHADFLAEQLQPLIDLTSLHPHQRQLHRRVGSPRWRRAMAARNRIELVTLLNGRESLSNNEIRDMIVSLIADGYEVTSGAALRPYPGLKPYVENRDYSVVGGPLVASEARCPLLDDVEYAIALRA